MKKRSTGMLIEWPGSQLVKKPKRHLLVLIICSAGLLAILSLLTPLGPASAITPVSKSAQAFGSSLINPSPLSEPNALYLPALAKWTYQMRSLGQLNLVSGPTDCLGEKCYTVSITCPGVAEPISGSLKVGGPSDSSKKGTIFFASGYTGSYYWENTDSPLLMQAVALGEGNDYTPDQRAWQIEAVNSHNRTILDHLQADGFQTVQIQWEAKGWYMAKSGQVEGQARLACRSATLMRWVYSQFHQGNIFKPYCAVGHSNGASQVSYSLAHYGQADILSAVILESGPNFARIDYSCYPGSAYFTDHGERSEIDKAFGGSASGNPCVNSLESFRGSFEEASLLIGNWRYQYPNTMVAFVFGGADSGYTAKQGNLYYDYLAAQGTPWLSKVVVPDAPHCVTYTPEGMQAVEDAIRNSCQIH